jgi:diamine N-acetyltransferase
MNKQITLKVITDDDLHDVIKLSDTLTDEQKKCVAPNVYSLAEAYVNQHIAWPRAIYLDDQPIGFVMLSLDNNEADEADKPSYYLWRFMMAREHQQKGYGKQVLDMIVDKCKQEGVKTLFTSCNQDTLQPFKFYVDYGFIYTNEIHEGEKVLKLTF